MRKTAIALGLAGLLLVAGSPAAPAAFTVLPAQSVISSLKSDLTEVAGSAVDGIVGGEGAANGAGVIGGAGFVAAEARSRRGPAFLPTD
jgi:hypothetical protein